ncbi:hypothetical protein [Winogradskyella sp.]|uniref:hypothetical protein n=1 Tax=Winogradskyella sp. TaxID=1883156 RepID=UPI0025D9ABC2|nr:hypothetical protein [Winogradskyella sp.]
MKIKIVLLALLLLGIVLPSELFAQTQYANPDASRMRLLLAKIEDCNTDITDAEAEIETFKKIDSEASLALYNQLKKNVRIATKCKKASQKEYDDLRADYEGWFGDETSVMSVDRQRITSAWLNQYLIAMISYYGAMYIVFNGIAVPEH